MKRTSFPWPIGFSVGNQLENPIPTLENTARMAPRWRKDGLQALEIGLFGDFHTQDLMPAEHVAALPGCLEAITDAGCPVWSVHLPFGVYHDLSTPQETLRSAAVDEAITLMTAAAKGGAKVAVIHPSAEPIADEDRPRHREQCRRSIEALTAAMGGSIAIAMECLPRSCLFSSAQEAYDLLDGTDAGLCMDTNHPHHEPPAQFIRKLGKKIVTCHISDDDGLDEKHWMPGTGVISWEDVLRALLDIPYQGRFIYELTPPSGLERAGLDFSHNARYLWERYQQAEGRHK
jgi:sugar phosphate isomerase/epimerase